jgi:hypothetical protein
MALTVTIGGASSDSYVTEAEFTAFATAMGWTITGLQNEEKLRRGRFALDNSYAWRGVKATEVQALAHPRVMGEYVDGYAVPSDTIPQAVKDAQCWMAYLIDGGADPMATLSTGAVTMKREKVDGVERETQFASGTERDRPAYPAVDLLVYRYATGKAGARAFSFPLMRG